MIWLATWKSSPRAEAWSQSNKSPHRPTTVAQGKLPSADGIDAVPRLDISPQILE